MDLRTLQRLNRYELMKARSHRRPCNDVETPAERMITVTARYAGAMEWVADAVHELRLLARKASKQP